MDDRPIVMNLADAPAFARPRRAIMIDLEPDEAPWPDLGVNVQVMQPGQPNCKYHSEPVQEDFLVLHGECIVILEGEERPLKQWDFVHCPPNTAHVIVGAGDGPSVILMVGARGTPDRQLVFPKSEAAAKYNASAKEDTSDRAVAYADWPPLRPGRFPWPPEGVSG